MLLIATDEAGYGPKLGPLVVVGTLWKIPGGDLDLDPDHRDALFVGMRTPQAFQGRSITVDDSKAVYRPGDGLDSLHAAVSASHHWCGQNEATLQECLPQLAPADIDAIAESPWLGLLSDVAFLKRAETESVRAAWGQSGIVQTATRARVITASRFNQICAAGANKAELLSETTIGLVHELLELEPSGESVVVYCDRHGGRRYYAGVLQHVLPGAIVQVVSESSRQSVYQVMLTGSQGKARSVRIHFTVKGDSFTPVALSSMHAKYLRERFMESFNEYFRLRHRGASLKPTAGYPVDADRFIADIATTLDQQRIDRDRLVRCR